MTLIDHARTELAIIQRRADADNGEPDAFQRDINESLLAIVEKFAEAGHSGGSAGYAIGMLGRLLTYEPLTPLTGEDSEWMPVDYGPPEMAGIDQNVRCSRVFRENGVAYDSEAVVYRERGGSRFTGYGSRRKITFPYVPKTRQVAAWRRRPERAFARLRGQLA